MDRGGGTVVLKVNALLLFGRAAMQPVDIYES